VHPPRTPFSAFFLNDTFSRLTPLSFNEGIHFRYSGNDMPADIPTDLIARAQMGEPAVIGALYERFHLNVFRYLYYRLGDQYVAEDLTSEVFIRMIRSLSAYQPQNVTFQAWLFQIARNLAIDHYRKMGVRDEVKLNDDQAPHGEDVDAAVDRKLTSDRLQRALAKLTDDQRDVIVMRFVADMPIAQVAQSLHKSVDSIKGLQRRALIALREILTEWEVSYV
jgi:RNA polymerase sigma-70 factor (ECF subfamily)